MQPMTDEEMEALIEKQAGRATGTGSYLRRLLTSLGQIDVTVPRSREGGSPADVHGSLPAQE